MVRKSVGAWFYWAILTGSSLASPLTSANTNGLDAYREGNYPLASQLLLNQADKNPIAKYYLGTMHLYGYGELRNQSLAFRYFEEAAEKGVVESQFFLARYYLTQTKSYDKAFKWFKKAAANGNTDAQLFCGAAFLYGFATKKNPENGWRYFLDAAKSGNAMGQLALAEHFFSQRSIKNKKLGIGWINKSVQQNNPKAQYRLAQLYEAGVLVKKDSYKMYELYKQAAAQSYAPAMVKLGEIAIKQNDIRSARDWLLKAVAINPDAETQYFLATLYLDPTNQYYNEAEGLQLIRQAAEKGSSKAQEKLAGLYRTGQGVPLDLAIAEEWQKKAKENPKHTAEIDPKVAVARWLSNDKFDDLNFGSFSLAGIYNEWKNPDALKENNYNASPQMGTITKKEIYQPQFKMIQPQEIAITDYLDKIAIATENKQALTVSSLKALPRYPIDPKMDALHKEEALVLQSVGSQSSSRHDIGGESLNSAPQTNPVNYLEQKMQGSDKQIRYQAALTQLYEQAILGETNAQFQIGQLYHYGIGVAKNIPQAMTYYRLAALQQDLRAEYNLGLLYLEGQTDPIDYNLGLTWLNSAAFKGNVYAQYALAMVYEKGLYNDKGDLVVRADPEQALTLFYLASASHYGPAEYRLASYLTKQKTEELSVSAREKKSNLIRSLYSDAVRSGVREASLPLAFYDAMDKSVEKQRNALAIASQEAKEGSSEAALLMGMMLERGLGVAANELEALYWYQRASLNPVSAFILGTYYSQGKGLAKDKEKGKALLAQSANAGFSYAYLNLSVMQQGAGEEFLPTLEKAAQLGNSTAGLLLADYYLAQSNDSQKIQKAQEIYRYFAEKGDRNAQLKLAYLYDQGIGVSKDVKQAASWYTAAAEQGLPIAQYLLGQFYQLGKIDGKPNYAEAKKWYKAAEPRNSRAAIALGFVHDTVDDNYESALKSYEQASSSNDAIGLYNLGLMYEYGKGTKVEYGTAKECYTRAAELGHPKAMNQLANLYFRGLGVSRDEEQALKYYHKAANLGDADSLYQLGLLSETGIATFDLSNAVRYYEQASRIGNNEKAKLALARMYQYGIGVNADPKKVTQYYTELAANNNAYAQYQLALMHFDNANTANNKTEGKRLLQQANANGSNQAQRVLQWLDAQQEQRVSYIEPVQMDQKPALANQSPELMYLDAISEWNRGDEVMSRHILNRVMSQFPEYMPAKKVYEQVTQPKMPPAVSVSKQES